MIQVSDFSALTDDLQSIFNEASRNAIAEMKGQMFFDVRDTNRRTYDHLVLHGMAGIERVGEGADLPSIHSAQGDNITFTQKRYGGLVSVTKDMRMFDLHDQIESIVRSVAGDAFDKVDQSMADVLLNGYSTSYTDVYGDTETATCTDGLALFSASHNNNINSSTFSNIISDSAATVNPALSRDAIVTARKTAATFQDVNSIVRPIKLDTLLVTPTNEDLAERIILSNQMSGTGNNDTNPLRGKVTIQVWERLESTGQGTSRSNYWYMLDSAKVKESLKAFFAERPSLDAPEQVYKNKNWDYSVDFYYTLGRGFPAYVRASKGTNAA
jgi:hypothetical protein